MAKRPTLTLEFEFRDKRYKDAHKGLQAFAKHLGKGLHRAGPILSREMKDFLDTVASSMSKVHGSSWPGGTSKNTLSKRSGAGIRSIVESVQVSGKKIEQIEGIIGGNFYMKTHEFGATIRAKKSQYLTIPLPAALDARGVPRKKKARDWDKTFIAKSKKGNLLIFQRRGHSIIPLYVLKKKVVIPPRLGLGKTLRSHIPYFVDTAMQAMLREFV